MLYETQEQLDKAVAYWQEVLSLRDWRINATVSPLREFSDKDRDGEARVLEEHKFARIWLIAPEDYPSDVVLEHDHEDTLVHEMLHIFFEPLNPEEDKRIDVHIEQSISALARAFVKLKRD